MHAAPSNSSFFIHFYMAFHTFSTITVLFTTFNTTCLIAMLEWVPIVSVMDSWHKSYHR